VRRKIWVFCILVILLINCAVCLSEVATDSNVIWLIPIWEKGEKRIYEIVKIREQNQPPMKSTSRTSAEILVLEESDSGYKMQWKWGKVTIDGAAQTSNPIVQRFANLQEGLSIKFRIDEAARIEEVENWEEIRDYILKAIGIIQEESRSSGADANVLIQTASQMRSMFSNKEQIKTFCIGDIQLFMAAIGRDYDPCKPFEYEDRIANPFGGEPLPTKGKFSLKVSDVKSDNVLVLWEQVFDSDKALKAITEGIGKMAPNPEKVRREMLSQLKDFSIEDHGEYSIDKSSGWIERMSHMRITKSGGIFQKDSITMSRKNNQIE
jgi:hypothetical protein